MFISILGAAVSLSVDLKRNEVLGKSNKKNTHTKINKNGKTLQNFEEEEEYKY